MKINKMFLLFCSLLSLSISAQKINEYKFLAEGQYNSKIYEKFEKKEESKVNLWHKVEESLENNPGVAFTEFYVQIDCKAKASILKTSITHWRDGTVQKLDNPSNKAIPITDLKSILGLAYQRYCNEW